MISAFLLGTVALLGPAALALSQVSAADPALTELGRSGELELFVRASPTQLLATNPTPHPIYLRFGWRSRGLGAGLLLAPRTQLEARFPAGTLDGLLLEALSFDAQGPHASGALPLEELLVEGVLGLWIDRTPSAEPVEPAGLSAWIVDGAGRWHLPPEKSLLKGPGLASPTHVPGVTPRENQRRVEAPKLHRRPLPPL
jgi:hypothetical protein